MSMTIDRVGPIDPIQPGKKPGQTGRVTETAKSSDSITLSPEALEKGGEYRAVELVFAAADVRADRIAELKSKINDPSYINDTIIETTADKLMDVFGL
jgi:negative regulator of flagellin synthesis FlgM